MFGCTYFQQTGAPLQCDFLCIQVQLGPSAVLGYSSVRQSKIDKLCKTVVERPMTIVHLHLNCSLNMYVLNIIVYPTVNLK